MKERPILFIAPMVRAILDGRKTQTRRIVKWQGPKGYPHSFDHAKTDNPAGVMRLLVPYNHPSESKAPWWEHGAHRHYCPQGDPGDRLWVRETWRVMRQFDDVAPRPRDIPNNATVEYDADDYRGFNGKTRVSIHMPRWASRITLEITGVRVERLDDISEADAKAEGAVFHDGHGIGHSGWRHDQSDGYVFGSARGSLVALWNKINGAGAWDKNPWVWVIEFKQLKGEHDVSKR